MRLPRKLPPFTETVNYLECDGMVLSCLWPDHTLAFHSLPENLLLKPWACHIVCREGSPEALPSSHGLKKMGCVCVCV